MKVNGPKSFDQSSIVAVYGHDFSPLKILLFKEKGRKNHHKYEVWNAAYSNQEKCLIVEFIKTTRVFWLPRVTGQNSFVSFFEGARIALRIQKSKGISIGNPSDNTIRMMCRLAVIDPDIIESYRENVSFLSVFSIGYCRDCLNYVYLQNDGQSSCGCRHVCQTHGIFSHKLCCCNKIERNYPLFPFLKNSPEFDRAYKKKQRQIEYRAQRKAIELS